MSLLTHEEIKKYLALVPKTTPENRAKIQALLEMDKIERSKDTRVFIVELSPVTDDLPC